MEKNSKIKSISFKSTWNGPNGDVQYHDIELENGDKGQIGAKEKLPEKLQVGKTLYYTIEANPKGNKIKAVQPPQESQGGPDQPQNHKTSYQKSDVDIASFAMAYTKDLIVGGKVEMLLLPETFEQIFALIKSKQK